jgi:hypothetical protein
VPQSPPRRLRLRRLRRLRRPAGWRTGPQGRAPISGGSPGRGLPSRRPAGQGAAPGGTGQAGGVKVLVDWRSYIYLKGAEIDFQDGPMGRGFVFRNPNNTGSCGCGSAAGTRRSALREVPVFNGLHRFLPSILRYQGYQVVEIPVHHRPRTRGQAKYGIGNRLWRGLRDCFAMRWYRDRTPRGDRWENEKSP